MGGERRERESLPGLRMRLGDRTWKTPQPPPLGRLRVEPLNERVKPRLRPLQDKFLAFGTPAAPLEEETDLATNQI